MTLPDLPLGTPVQVSVQVHNGQLTLVSIESASEPGDEPSAQPTKVAPGDTTSSGGQVTGEASEAKPSGDGAEIESADGGGDSSPSGDGQAIGTPEPGDGGQDTRSGGDDSERDGGSDSGSGDASGPD
jgi:hypothetical protein